MNKLIKVSETHYVIVDDSEIKEGNWVVGIYPSDKENKLNDYYLAQANGIVLGNVEHGKQLLFSGGGFTHEIRYCKKITHSTTELEAVQNIPLSYVEELLYVYNLNDLSKKHFPTPVKIAKRGVQYYKQKIQNPLKGFKKWDKAFKCGFKVHQELTKDKIFTIEDIRKAIIMSATSNTDNLIDRCEEIINLIQPKTEWNITIDENNKITLL